VSLAAGTTAGDAHESTAPLRSMRALMLIADRKIELREVAAPPAPAAGEVQIAIKAVGLNHIDVWGWRGMAFAKRRLPLVVGAEAAGEVVAVGRDVVGLKAGDRVVPYGGLTCGRMPTLSPSRTIMAVSLSAGVVRGSPGK